MSGPKPYELRVLDPATTHFTFDSAGQLWMTSIEDPTPRSVRAIRTFPLTAPEDQVAIQDSGEDGEELGVVMDVSRLASADAAALGAALEARYIVARIRQIKKLKEEYGHLRFDVVTDRGERTFYVVDAYDAVIPVTGTRRILLQDVDGARYEIPDLDALPQGDRRLIEQRLYL